MALSTSKPTGRPTWPVTLLAGGPGSGKTHALIEASASPIVDRAYILTLGEVRPDEYSSIEGARFEHIDHFGTYESILEQVREVAALRPLKKPILFGFDGIGALWTLIVANKQAEANRRRAAAARAARAPAPVGDAKIDGDLWELAHLEWYAVLNTIRTLSGPSVVTTRLDETDKGWRMRGEKNLAYDVTAVVQMIDRGDFVLTKCNSQAVNLTGPRTWPDFTIDALWRAMEVDVAEMGVATLANPVATAA